MCVCVTTSFVYGPIIPLIVFFISCIGGNELCVESRGKAGCPNYAEAGNAKSSSKKWKWKNTPEEENRIILESGSSLWYFEYITNLLCVKSMRNVKMAKITPYLFETNYLLVNVWSLLVCVFSFIFRSQGASVFAFRSNRN